MIYFDLWGYGGLRKTFRYWVGAQFCKNLFFLSYNYIRIVWIKTKLLNSKELMTYIASLVG
jgi:hypothetical protein